MARAKQNAKPKNTDMSVIDLGEALGLTKFKDSDWALVQDRLPTFLPQYDSALGGGIPFGRLTEIYGEKASGKSTFAVHLTKVANALGVFVVWIDVEGTADRDRMAQLGVDNSKSFLIQNEDESTMTVESVGEHLEELIPKFKELAPNEPILIIWDSVAATVTKKELEKDFGNEQPGIKAKALTQMINKVAPLITSSKTALVAINQVRDVMGATMYQEKVSSTGGRAFEHWASLSLLFKKAGKVTINSTDKENYGHTMRMTTKKSKVSRPNQQAEAKLLSDFPLSNGEVLNGFDYEYNMYSIAGEVGLIKGTTYKSFVTLNGEEIKKRPLEWVIFLKSPEGEEVLSEIFARVLFCYFPKGYSPLNNENIDILNSSKGAEGWKGIKESIAIYEELVKDYLGAPTENKEQADANDLIAQVELGKS